MLNRKGEAMMDAIYKEKLLREIDDLPDEIVPVFYRMIHQIKNKLMLKTEKSGNRGSLKGIWKGSKIDEAMFAEAKRTLFPYESE